ncbi:SPRY domain-containing SOCS box protein 4-like, partial [Homalodisca vitripennis]|uniref:SPRY domain-containing SOCS box protein 4-like n=1 Tax=Homalodisca vitripennis TaxID=197043 RepID=UPI001EEC15E3
MTLNTEPQHHVSLRSVQQLAVPIRLRAVLNCPVDSLQDHERKALNSHGYFHNISIKDPLIFERCHLPRSRTEVRGNIGFTEGVHAWEICWPKQFRGSHAVIGVASKDKPLHCGGYQVIVLDMQEGNLSFYIDGFCLGIAFCGLKGKTLYPTISSVFPNCQISIKYIGPCD